MMPLIGLQMTQHKKRKTTVSFKIAEMSEPADGIRIDCRTGKVSMLAKGVPVTMRAENVSVSVSYEREKKPKVLTAMPQPSADVRMSLFSFLEDFDVVFAVDTNTRLIGTVKHSVAIMSIMEIRDMIRTDGILYKTELNINMFGCIIRGKDMIGNPENWMWKLAIEEGVKKRYPKYTDALRVGLVVDSNLGELPEYNARTKPIFEDYFLPPNFSLVYASADGGAEYLPNRLLRLCDKEAEMQLDALAAGKSETDEVIYTTLNEHEEINHRFPVYQP